MGGSSKPAQVAQPAPVPAVMPQPLFGATAPNVARPVNASMPMGQSPAANNVFTQSAGALTSGINAANAAASYKPQQVGTSFGYTPQNVTAGQAYTGMANYQNPFTQQVIDTSMADLERQRQMQMAQMGAQASAAGAFGGSRHGVAEALTNEGFFNQGGQLASGLRMQGFNTALGASQQDVANQLQAALANQGAGARAQEFGQSSRLQAQIANQQAANQAAAQRAAAASTLGNLSQTGFNMGMGVTQQQMQQGAMQQAMNQTLIDAGRAQYAGFAGAPAQSLATSIGALGASKTNEQTTTSTKSPGLFDYLTAGATILPRLCWVAREVYGEEDDRWMQFRTWLVGAAPDWLFNAYVKHGEAFAGVVRKVPALKRILRPLMDRARRAVGFEG
jgi:hypothetical protein